MIVEEIDDALLKMDMKDDAGMTERELDVLLMTDTKVIEDLLTLDDNQPLHSWDDTLSKMDMKDNVEMEEELNALLMMDTKDNQPPHSWDDNK
ncbi:hypothetical protein AHAS_Ahas06G0137600 [Arachis hypogaea]